MSPMLLRCVVLAPLAFGQTVDGTCVPLVANLDVTGVELLVDAPGAPRARS